MKETIKPITDEYIDKEVFENESQIDTNILNELDVTEPGLEIKELIYQYIESDDDWRDLSLTTELESWEGLQQTVPLALNSISLCKIRKFARRCYRL